VVRDFKPRNGDQYTAGPLLFDPGEQWLYGTSTDWVGRLVESVSGQSLEQYFHERIFRPLEMTDTFYNPPKDKQQRLVVVHRRQSDGAFAADANQPPISVTTFSGGGGLASTASDYIRFLQMVLNGGTLGGSRILSPESIALMAANQIGNVRVRALKTAMPERSSDFTFVNDGRDMWGLGFMITAVQQNGKRSAGSLSWGGINNTYFWVDRTRGIAGVILMQFLPFADTKALAVCDAFERAVYDFVER
jgi:CubicO group peptidase (beta-lactamase class C family)